jgi:hypothetical protein
MHIPCIHYPLCPGPDIGADGTNPFNWKESTIGRRVGPCQRILSLVRLSEIRHTIGVSTVRPFQVGTIEVMDLRVFFWGERYIRDLGLKNEFFFAY